MHFELALWKLNVSMEKAICPKCLLCLLPDSKKCQVCSNSTFMCPGPSKAFSELL